MRALQAFSALALSAGLAACGGGSSGDAVPGASNEVPVSATASIASFIEYAGSVMRSETAEPLSVDNARPPTSETDEPISVP